jgi:hypothetical protein
MTNSTPFIRGAEQGQALELIRRYFRAYLHCWKCVPHFVREIKRLSGKKNDSAWIAWTQRWALKLDASDYEVFECLRKTRDHDTHEIAAGFFPICYVPAWEGFWPPQRTGIVLRPRAFCCRPYDPRIPECNLSVAKLCLAADCL